jgi:hypothetical protein
MINRALFEKVISNNVTTTANTQQHGGNIKLDRYTADYEKYGQNNLNLLKIENK